MRPKDRSHGDWATNIAMQCAKKAGLKPRDLAQSFADELAQAAGIAKVEVAGPGFINITLDAASAASIVDTILSQGEAFGRNQHLADKTLNLEFVSANPTGPIHIGGTRWAAVGDSMARVLEANGATVVREYYFNDNDKVLPRSIATREAFLNAMSLDIAMGGSTNTVLHLLAVAREAGVDFTMKDIDTLSRKLPVLCKVAPNHSPYHIQEVNRAGGILAILGILMRAGLIDGTTLRADGLTLAQAIAKYDIYNLGTTTSADTERYLSAPGGKFNITLGSQRNMYPDYDTDRAQGCIRDIDHAYMKDGGLAVLYGNIAADGCIVKTAGVDASILVFDGTACVFDSQEQASKGILDGTVKAGDIVIIRYEGPKGGPGMQEMLYPTSYLKTVKLDKACALLTDGRFSGGTSGLSIGHCSPEAAAGGLIAAVENGDKIHIDIPNRTITLEVADDVLAQRMEQIRTTTGFRPNRQRTVSKALQAYANMVSSADKGAIRIVE